MAATSYDSPHLRSMRSAGVLLLTGLAASLLWRMVLAPVLLGDFNSAAMPSRDRGILALGLLTSALITASGLASLAAALRPARVGQIITGASIAAFVGTAVLGVQIVLLLTGGNFLGLFNIFAVLTTGAWIATSIALVRAGILKWSGMLTALLSALAMVSLLAGAFIIFIMFLATLPLTIGLLLRRSAAVATTVPAT